MGGGVRQVAVRGVLQHVGAGRGGAEGAAGVPRADGAGGDGQVPQHIQCAD
ncbi:MAG: hypothetical protein IJK36_08365 [Bacteroidales bacterium]|nr:hypothetical protein [Bacteroidales bacterium]